MFLDRHRVAKLVEPVPLERPLQGPGRLLREEEVATEAHHDVTEDPGLSSWRGLPRRLATGAPARDTKAGQTAYYYLKSDAVNINT